MVNAFRWMIFVIGLAVVIGSIMVTSATLAEDHLILSIESPFSGEVVYSKMITVSGTAAAMGGDYIDCVTVNGFPAGRDTWSADILLQEGPNRITVVATTDIGNTATETITVSYKAQPYGIALYVDPTAKTVYVNDTATYILVVNKSGNINTLDLAVKGIGSLDKNSVTLDDDQVSLSITSTTIGSYVTTVTATSQDDHISAYVSVSTRVVTPDSAEIVQIDSNGSAIFRSEVIKNVIPKIQFFRGYFGYVAVNILLNSTAL